MLLHIVTLDLHFEVLTEIFKVFSQHGVVLNTSKCELVATNIEYLGFSISQNQITVKNSYLGKIKNWPVPSDLKSLEQFLGFAGYYASFVIHFATRAYSLSELRKKVRNKTIKFQWSKECQDSFNDLKCVLLSNPVRSFPIYDFLNRKNVSPLILSTDFSCQGLSAILSQVQDSKERLISCASRKTTPAECNYSSLKGECRAVLFALEKYDKFISLQSFFYVITDSVALKYLLSLKTSSKIFSRWSTIIFSFPVRILHRSGKLSQNSDILSRNQNLMDDFRKSDLEYEGISALHITQSNFTQPFTPQEISSLQHSDRVCSEAISWIESGQPDTSQLYDEKLLDLFDRYPSLEIIEDILYLNLGTDIPDYKIVTPLSMQYELIRNSHSYLTGHYRLKGTVDRLRQSFYWMSMQSDVQKFISKCLACNVTGPKTDFFKGPHGSMENMALGSLLCMDLKGPLTVDAFDFKYILVIIECSTRFIITEPLKTKESKEVCKAILNRWLPIFGIPAKILSDQGTEFQNSLFKQLCNCLMIKHNFCPVDQHSGNIAERPLRDLNAYLKMIGQENFRMWSTFLPIFGMAYNSHVHNSLGTSPYRALTGRNMLLPVELCTVSTDPNHPKIPIERIINMIINDIFLAKGKALQTTQNRYKHHDILKQNVLVWLYITPTSRLSVCWTGPYIVLKSLGTSCYFISPAFNLRKIKPILVHQSRLKPCKVDITSLTGHIGSTLLSVDIIQELPTPLDLIITTPEDDPELVNDFDEPIPLIPVFKNPPPGPQTTSLLPHERRPPPGPQITSSLSNESLTPTRVSTPSSLFVNPTEPPDTDNLIDVLTTPIISTNVEDEIQVISKPVGNSSNDKPTFVSPQMINEKDDLVKDIIFQRKDIPYFSQLKEDQQFIKQVGSLSSNDQQIPLYCRSSHTLISGKQTIRLISQQPVSEINAIKFAPIADEIEINSLTQSKQNIDEFHVTIENKKPKKYNFKIGQKFAILTLIHLFMFSTLVSAQKLVLKQQVSTIGYNCKKPLSIDYIDRDSRCQDQSQSLIKEPPLIYDLLAHTTKDEVPGHFCSIIKSSLLKQCGILSIEKTLQVPNTQVPVMLSNLQCMNMVATRTYKTKDGQVFPLELGTDNFLHFQLNGQVHSSASEGSYCSGSRIKTDTGYVSSGFQLVQLQITLKKINVISEENKRLIVKESMTYLPSKCHIHDRICLADHGIFIWEHRAIKNCAFQYYKQTTL